MINKIIEKVIARFIAKKYGISNGIVIKSIEVNAVSDRHTKISLDVDITVKNEDVFNWVDKTIN